jgi:hypothetical protein
VTKVKKIGVFIPMSYPLGLLPEELFKTFFASSEYMMSHLDDYGEDVTVQLYTPKSFPTDAARNEAVGIILEEGIDTSIWLDADQSFTQTTLYDLLIKGKDYPIYSGMYYLKTEPFHPIIFRDIDNFELFSPIWRFPTNTLFYADMIGMGCVKIDREVFLNLDQPYFKYAPIPKKLAEKSEMMALKLKYGVNDVSEDVHFWRQVRDKTDYRIVVDPSIQVGHVRKEIVDFKKFHQYAKMNKYLDEKDKGDKFAEYWEKGFPLAELVNPGGDKAEWIL